MLTVQGGFKQWWGGENKWEKQAIL